MVLLALLVSAPLALAAEGEPTREEYVQRVDVICKKSEKTNSRILKDVKRQVAKKHQFIPAGNRFLRASRSFGRAVKQIAAVPQPSADEAKLGKWVKYLKVERSLLQRIGQALKREQGGKANKLAVQLHRINRRANNTVFSFEFDYCDR
jgi:hypothetical protein